MRTSFCLESTKGRHNLARLKRKWEHNIKTDIIAIELDFSDSGQGPTAVSYEDDNDHSGS